MPKAKRIRIQGDPTKNEGQSPTSSNDSLNTEIPPAPPQPEQAPPCSLCLWLEKRMNNTSKEMVKHMEKYHVS